MRKVIFGLAICFVFLSGAASAQTRQPRTVREFFNLLPQKYFTLEGCEPRTDKNCETARQKYIQTFLEIEDTANGYWKSGCDGGQSCLTMALFKRPDATYVVALQKEFESGIENHFLEYRNGKWFDIAARIVPNFSKNNVYELPQKGTTVQVYKRRMIDDGFDERGAKLYNLLWQNGKFVKQK
jgi:hypothetical protein